MSHARIVLVTLIALLTGAAVTAQEPLARGELDKRLDQVLYDISRRGTDLFNRAGNEDGCYHHYEGSLRTVVVLLDHRPELQKSLRDALARAERESAPQRSFTLRKAIEEVRTSVRPPRPAPPPTPTTSKTLWERLGGEPAVNKVVKEFIAAAAPDPKVNFTRGGKFPVDPVKLQKTIVEMVSAVAGGPLKYSGRDMKTAHAGMKITAAEFDALAGHLAAVLKANKVPDRETKELMDLVGSTKKDIVEVK